jgi:hypothetical protein
VANHGVFPRRNAAGVEKPHSPACFSVFVPLSGRQRPAEAPIPEFIVFEVEFALRSPQSNSKVPRPKFEGFRHGLLGQGVE